MTGRAAIAGAVVGLAMLAVVYLAWFFSDSWPYALGAAFAARSADK